MLVCSIAMLVACAAPQKQASLIVDPLTPLPDELLIREPDNDIFMSSLERYIRKKGGPASTQYEFTRIDLDGDGQRDGIAVMKTPHEYWCNSNGCSMAVFRADGDRFVLSSEISSVRGPIIVSQARSNGWRDLVVRISGRKDIGAKDVALRFDGKRYPPQPAFEPKLEIAAVAVEGTRIFP